MHQLCLTIAILKPDLRTIGLEILKIRYGTYLQPALLRRAEYLEIISECRSKTHVAAAKTKYTVRQLQFLQQLLYMHYHLLQHFIAFSRVS